MRRSIYTKLKKRAFVIEIDTTKVVTGSTDAQSFQLRFRNVGFNNVLISWGDGTTSNYNGNEEINHIYPISGIYIVRVRQYANNSQLDIRQNNLDGKKTMRALDWGDLSLADSSFAGNSNLDLSVVNGMPIILELRDTFNGCSSITTINNINDWVAKGAAQSCFRNCTNFNQPLNFNTSSVTHMQDMFYGCTSFNSSITLNTISVTNMGTMFQMCSVLNSIITLNTVNVVRMDSMFRQCTKFNQPLNFNTSSVTNMSDMFRQCTNFNQPLNFNTANVTNMSFMFHSAPVFNQDISAWNVSSVTTMVGMFTVAYAFNQDISAWDVSNVTDMTEMFYLANAFNKDISAWNFNKNVILKGFMQGKTSANYNASYYDNLLQKWAATFIGTGRTQTNKNLHMGGVKYTVVGKYYRDHLVADGWIIIDGGII